MNNIIFDLEEVIFPEFYTRIEITSSLPMWNLPDRKVYLYGSNVDRNNDKSTFSNVCIIIKMK